MSRPARPSAAATSCCNWPVPLACRCATAMRCWRPVGSRGNGERDLSAPEVADAKRAIDLLLRRHEPFPAIVTDRQWNVLQANRAAMRLMTALLGTERMKRPLNHMKMFLAPDELRPFVENWPDVA